MDPRGAPLWARTSVNEVPWTPRSLNNSAALSIIFWRALDLRGMFYDGRHSTPDAEQGAGTPRGVATRQRPNTSLDRVMSTRPAIGSICSARATTTSGDSTRVALAGVIAGIHPDPRSPNERATERRPGPRYVGGWLTPERRRRRPPGEGLQHHPGGLVMPMIDVYAVAGTFSDKHTLASNLAGAVMRWEQVPDLPLFRNNTAGFVHDLPDSSLANVNGDSNYVRVQVLTPTGALDRDKQIGVVKELTEIVAAAAGDPSLAQRTWVLLTEAPEGGWGIAGHANTGADIAQSARAELAAKAES